ncbi:hypothetical protein BH11VER1_BH11VER1_01470 [soil metagenome]
MNASSHGKMIAPKGINRSNESHGDNPAFLQMNQNGTTATKATIPMSNTMTSNSMEPSGAVEVFMTVFLPLNVEMSK